MVGVQGAGLSVLERRMPQPLRGDLGHQGSSQSPERVSLRSAALLCAAIGFGFGASIAAASPPGVPVAAVSPAAPVPSRGTDESPALATGAHGHRSEIEAAWFQSGMDLVSRAAAARHSAVQLGAVNVEAPARALIVAPGNESVRLEQALLAVSLAPDLPVVRMALARTFFEVGRYPDALAEAAAGLAAIPRNLEATAWLAASLLTMFATVLVAGSLLLIVWVGLSAFAHAAHDLGDLVSSEMPDFARTALLGSILTVPVVFGEALMGVVLGFFALGFMYGGNGARRVLVLAAALVVLGLYPVARVAGLALTALDSDPVATAAHNVLRAMESPADVEMLRRVEAKDPLAEASLALRERRGGDPEIALERYMRLLEKTPTDPVVLAVLANMMFERGDNERAILFGERAAGLTRSATLLFNLSQAYARSFRMDEFEGALAQAQSIDAGDVARLSGTASPDFVADLPFPLAPIRERMLAGASDDGLLDPVLGTLVPGLLGQSWMATALGFALAALLALGVAGRWEHSSSCERCGKRICNRCDGTVWNSEICDGCHHLFNRPETTDPRLRVARLSELRERELRLGRISLVASIMVPGVGGLLARRPGLAFLGLFFSAWGVALFVWRDGVIPDPLAVGAAGSLAFLLAGILAGIGYALVVVTGLTVRENR